MSKISLIHQALLDKIAILLPDHVRMSDPYNVDQNNELFLRQGFGIKIGEGQNAKISQGCQTFIRRAFSVVLTREYRALESDADARASTEKQILEDALLIQKEIEADQTVGGQACSASFESDSGIEAVLSTTDRYLKTEINFLIEYFETL